MRHLTDNPAERPLPGILDPHHAHSEVQAAIARFAEDLRRKEAYCLGFIPAESYAAAIARRRLLVAMENDEPCGFVLWAKRKGVLRFHQTAIVKELRRLRHATDIVAGALNTPEGRAAKIIRLRVADDLAANQFWQAIGFQKTGQQPGGKTWNRNINIYTLPTHNRLQVALKIAEGIIESQQKFLDKAWRPEDHHRRP